MTVKVGLLHLKPLTNSHFYFLITVESTTLGCGLSVSEKSVPPLVMHARLSLVNWTERCVDLLGYLFDSFRPLFSVL